MKFHQIKMKSHEILYESPLDPFGVSLVSPWCRHVCHVSPRNRRQRLPPGSDSAPSPCVRLTPRSWALSEWASPMVHFMGNIYIYHIHHMKYHERNHIYAIKWYHIWYISYGIMCIYIYTYIYIYGAPQKKTTMVFCFYCYLQCFYITFIIYYTQWAWYGIYVINNMI